MDSKHKIEDAEKAIAASPWIVFVVGLEVNGSVRKRCERIADASIGGMVSALPRFSPERSLLAPPRYSRSDRARAHTQYMHAGNAGGGLDAAFAAVAAQFVMPKVKSADAASSGGGVRGV